MSEPKLSFGAHYLNLKPEDQAWLEKLLLEIITDSYENWNKKKVYAPKEPEPKLTVAFLREWVDQAWQPLDYKILDKIDKNRVVSWALDRMRGKGLVISTVGMSEHGNEAKMYEPATKKEAAPKLFVKADHIEPRLPVFRKNYDYGEGFGKMVDEFRDGKIKDVHEFIEKKRKEPSPIKLWKEKRRNRKKKVKRAELNRVWRWEWAGDEKSGLWRLVSAPLRPLPGFGAMYYPHPYENDYEEGSFEAGVKNELLTLMTNDFGLLTKIEEGDTLEVQHPEGETYRWAVEPHDLTKIGQKEISIVAQYWDELLIKEAGYATEAIVDQARMITEEFENRRKEAEQNGSDLARAIEKSQKADTELTDFSDEKIEEIKKKLKYSQRILNVWSRVKGDISQTLVKNSMSDPNVWKVNLWGKDFGYVFIKDISGWSQLLNQIQQISLKEIGGHSGWQNQVQQLIPSTGGLHPTVVADAELQNRHEIQLAIQSDGGNLGQVGTLYRKVKDPVQQNFEKLLDDPSYSLSDSDAETIHNWFQSVSSFMNEATTAEMFEVGEKLQIMSWGVDNISKEYLDEFHEFEQARHEAEEWRAQNKQAFVPLNFKTANEMAALKTTHKFKSHILTGKELPHVYSAGRFKVKKVDKKRQGERDDGWYGEGFYVSFDADYVKTWYGPVLSCLKVKDDAKVLVAAVSASKARPELLAKVIRNDMKLNRERGAKVSSADVKELLVKNQIEWVHAVDRFAEVGKFDVVIFNDYEIVVKNGKVLEVVEDKRAELVPLVIKNSFVNVIVEPAEPAVNEALELVKQKMPGLLEQAKVSKIILESGDPGHFGEVRSNEPGVVRVSLEKIKSILGQQVDKQEILNQIAETIVHEAGHLTSNFQGGEAPAEQKANEFRAKLTSLQIPLTKKASNLHNLIDELSMWLDASKHELLAKKIAFNLGQYADHMIEYAKHGDVWVLNVYTPFHADNAFSGEEEWPNPIRTFPVHFNPKGSVSWLGTPIGNRSVGLQQLKEQAPELEAAEYLQWSDPESYEIYDDAGNFMAGLTKESDFGFVSNLAGNLEADAEYIKGPYDIRNKENEHKFLIYDQIRSICKQLAAFLKDAARSKKFDEIYKLGIAIKNLFAKIPLQPTPDEEMEFAKFDEMRVRPEKKPKTEEEQAKEIVEFFGGQVHKSSFAPPLTKKALQEHEIVKFFSGKMEAEVKAYDPNEKRFNILTSKHFKDAGQAFSYAHHLTESHSNLQVFVVLSWKNATHTHSEDALESPDFDKLGGTWAQIEYKSTGGGPLTKNREIYGYLDAFGKAHTVGDVK